MEEASSTTSRRFKSARQKSTPAAISTSRKKARTCTPQTRQGFVQTTTTPSTAAQTPAVSSAHRAPSACTPSRDLELVVSCDRDPSDQAGKQRTADGCGDSIRDAAQQQQLETDLAAQQPKGRSSTVLVCPVCEADLNHISHTESGRAAHVNACLDAGATYHSDAPASSPICIVDTQAPQEQPGGQDEVDSMQQWLEGIDAAEVAGIFSEAEIDLCVLPHLNDNDLQELGIDDVELRSRILQAAAAAAQPGTTHHTAAGSSQQQLQQQQATNMQELPQDQQQQHSEQQQPAVQPDGSEEWPADLLYSPGDADEQWDYAEAYMPQQHMSQQQWQEAGNWQEELPCSQQQCTQQQQQQQQQQDDGVDWQQQQRDDGVEWQQQQRRDSDWQQQQQQWQDDGYEWQQGQQSQDEGPSVYTQQSEQEPAEQRFESLQKQAAQHAEPWGLVSTAQHQQQRQHQQQHVAMQQHGVPGQQWQQHSCQVLHPPPQQQQQLPQRQHATGPLQALDVNQQRPAVATGGNPSHGSGIGQQAQHAGTAQCSITGFVTRQARQPQQQLQQRDAKEQWRALFKLPKQPLGAHNPQTRQQQPRQAQLSVHGRVVRATEQQQPAAAAAAESVPPPVLPQAAGPSLPSWWPAWQRLPGTNIIVDCFGRSCASVGSNRTWVLSHFHADHYMGLSKGFKQGRIICSPITAALVRLKLRVPPERLLVLELGQELQVEGTRLQLIDANHCPGAAMIVAHPPGGAPPVLHTGDARLTVEATRGQAVLRDLVGRAVLVLDTTYADPTYCFPPQQDVLDWVLKAVKAELFNPRCLFLFGTYTIGKERLFMHVATALQRKVYVAAAKRSIMSCLNLPPEQAALLTTNHLDANIHAVPMRQVTLEAMESLLLRYKGRYTAVVGFKPTGWSHAGGSGRNGQGAAAAAAAPAVSGPSRSSLSIKPNRRRSQRGTVVLYQVPYSEHSSCAELRSFVEWFKPLRIIPSVNNDGSNGPKLKAMLAAVTASTGPAAGPMDAFARPRQQRQQQGQ